MGLGRRGSARQELTTTIGSDAAVRSDAARVKVRRRLKRHLWRLLHPAVLVQSKSQNTPNSRRLRCVPMCRTARQTATRPLNIQQGLHR